MKCDKPIRGSAAPNSRRRDAGIATVSLVGSFSTSGFTRRRESPHAARQAKRHVLRIPGQPRHKQRLLVPKSGWLGPEGASSQPNGTATLNLEGPPGNLWPTAPAAKCRLKRRANPAQVPRMPSSKRIDCHPCPEQKALFAFAGLWSSMDADSPALRRRVRRNPQGNAAI